MPPIVHLVQHAQARSNVKVAAREEQDPELTEIGMQQVRDLACAFPSHNKIEAVFAPPSQRALQTALLAFEPTLKDGAKVVASPLAQETSHAPCDTGRDLNASKARCECLLEPR